ncbi:MAG TPA: hypothetical protein EYP23_03975 [Thermoplasmata archaeon]|nr:hypothetical protein [Thermoplasmata archaeon]
MTEVLMFFTIGHVLAAFVNMGIVLPLPFYVIVVILTHLLQVRILLLIGSINFGVRGNLRVWLRSFPERIVTNETVGVSLLGFTGVTINIFQLVKPRFSCLYQFSRC